MAILGLREFEAALKRVTAGADAAGRNAVAKAAAYAEAEAKSNFQGSHAPGQPHVGGAQPNVVTGTARRSIKADPVARYGLGDYGTIVAPRVVYGRRLELGYPAGGSGPGQQATAAFPYFIPAAEKTAERFHSIAAAEWARFLRG